MTLTEPVWLAKTLESLRFLHLTAFARSAQLIKPERIQQYSSGDADLFGPEEITAILEDKEESQQRKELVEKVKSEKTLIKKGFSTGGSPSKEPLRFGVQSNLPHDHEQQGGETFSYQSRSLKQPRSLSQVLQFIENKRKHMERQLSSAKRDQVLIDDARENT
ncbi:hypothetical protein P5673_026772 [Acropora cervicornis]|uniref:Uncharacterized protein n=1 Tax=Acropora cervicornis TaxID=6130 RepID=A0AAD9UWL1_ACRCE|nr:hypothetical protein P5673_026772 [Acropora cervicornis]